MFFAPALAPAANATTESKRSDDWWKEEVAPDEDLQGKLICGLLYLSMFVYVKMTRLDCHLGSSRQPPPRP